LTTDDIIAAANLSEAAKPLITPKVRPSRLVHLLESHNLFKDAIQFLAHGLPIALVVKWGCACSRELLPADQLQRSKESLDSAESWLQSPDDEARWRAKRAADQSGLSSPIDLVAMAVFLSGGSITPPDTPETPPPPYAANKLIGGSIQLAVLSQLPEKAGERYRSRELVKPERG
jgi:hypothetical protein